MVTTESSCLVVMELTYRDRLVERVANRENHCLCCRISFDIRNRNILVVDSINHLVQLFGEQGEYLNQFGEQGNLDHPLSSPHGLSLDPVGNILVADSVTK